MANTGTFNATTDLTAPSCGVDGAMIASKCGIIAGECGIIGQTAMGLATEGHAMGTSRALSGHFTGTAGAF